MGFTRLSQTLLRTTREPPASPFVLGSYSQWLNAGAAVCRTLPRIGTHRLGPPSGSGNHVPRRVRLLGSHRSSPWERCPSNRLCGSSSRASHVRRGGFGIPGRHIASAVGMIDETRSWLLACNRHVERDEGEFMAQVICHRPPDDAARGQVEHNGQLEPPLGRPDPGPPARRDQVLRRRSRFRAGWAPLAGNGHFRWCGGSAACAGPSSPCRASGGRHACGAPGGPGRAVRHEGGGCRSDRDCLHAARISAASVWSPAARVLSDRPAQL